MKDCSPDDLKNELTAGKTVFLKLWKHDCGVCKLSESATRRFEEDSAFSQVTFVQIDTDSYPEMLELAEAESLPAFVTFKDRKRKGTFVGFKGKDKLRDFLVTSLES